MTVVFIVLPVSLVVVGLAMLAYAWATRSGQFDDLETPAMRVLTDDADGRVEAELPGGRERRST